ncbi:GAF and ANTAR domain-containing protein [Herbiconiux sp. P15]|uniref:GAF and ANTAR domain-containing protein n=1 Tax=Herbiconiux liukaitaii TaxID=3342799 RepID=UPI0035B701AD
MLPVQHAAICTLGPPFDVETVGASDAIAGGLSEVQLDAGEGPGWDAYSTGMPVLEPDVHALMPLRWPIVLHALADQGVQSVFSFPLAVGSLKIGAVDLYSDTSEMLSDDSVAGAVGLASAASSAVLHRALDHLDEELPDEGPFSRREVHQATGMVVAQMRISPEDALLLIRAHAFASGRSVRETAADITTRRISLEP